jgi:hypothetical protein
MDATRKSALVAGSLFILADVAGIPSAILSTPLLSSADYLSVTGLHVNQMALAALLIFIMAFACAGIAFALYPVLKKHSPGLAIAVVGFRTMEAVFEIVAGGILLQLLSLSEAFLKTGSANLPTYQSLGTALRTANDWVGNEIVLTAW